MKQKLTRKAAALLLGGAVLVGTVVAIGSGDSLVSLSYLMGTYVPAVTAQGNNIVERGLMGAYQTALEELGQEGRESGETATGLYSTELSLKNGAQNEGMALNSGGVFVLYSGVIQMQPVGAVVNATTGQLVAAGETLTAGNRYIVGESATANLRVLSGSATYGIQGGYVSSFPGNAAHPFLDVTLNDWYNDAVGFVYTKSLFAGMGDGLFAPNAAMDRSMVMTVFYHLAGDPKAEMDSATARFHDVAADQWYAPYVAWGAEQGVTAGTGDGMFSPAQAVTRQQMVMLLYNFGRNYLDLELTGRSDLTGQNGADQVSDWALDAMQWAVANGIIAAGSDLAPVQHATRAQVAAMLKDFSQRYL